MAVGPSRKIQAVKHLWDLISRESKGARREIVIAAGVSGLANAAIVAIIGEASQTAAYDNINLRYLLLFMVAMALYIIGQRYSAMRMVRITTHLGQALRVRVVDKVQASELPVLERIGTSRIVNALSRDATTISDSGEAMIDGLQAVIFVSFAYAYIAWLSLYAFVLSVISAAAAMTIVMRQRARTQALLGRTRAMEVEFLNNVTDAIDGFKEARLNGRRREELQGDIHATSAAVTALREEVEDVQTRSAILGRSALYVLIALVVFLLPAVVQTYSSVITETVTAILFVVGPLGLLVGIVPYLERANEAARAISELEAQLDTENATAAAAATAHPATAMLAVKPITLDDARFAYKAGHGDLFVLGPVSFSVEPGEIVFLTGGNGTGKSTLLKLLTGLYLVDSGQILLGDTPVTRENLQSYREMFSAIFSDFHLFRRLYGLLGTDESAVTDLLRQMQLDHKVKFTHDRFSNLDLSSGQRKRLALVVSLLEDRPILVFDELAADQDPQFRRFLYEELLPGLKADGRTVIAATHDDRYFHVADKVVRLEYGKVDYVGPFERHAV
jgi:putative ATP-binding cassette transporter